MSVKAPSGLGAAGEQLWSDVAADYELRPDELRVLEAACRTADMIARLDAAMVDEPLMVSGSMGQLREHPLISESRQQRQSLAALLKQLKLPDEGASSSESRSSAARAAANARWSRRGA